MKFLIMNGPNLNLLGLREPDIYGKEDYNALLARCQRVCALLGVEMESFQSNHEGALVDRIQAAMGEIDGIVLNPAAYTHTSVAIPDALKAVQIPCVEVHLSDINSREAFRHVSMIAAACRGVICGFGLDSYRLAIEALAGSRR